jgi:hypothetical protein
LRKPSAFNPCLFALRKRGIQRAVKPEEKEMEMTPAQAKAKNDAEKKGLIATELACGDLVIHQTYGGISMRTIVGKRGGRKVLYYINGAWTDKIRRRT